MQVNQKGLIHIIVILILLAGIVATVWLVTQGPLKLFPKAGVSKPIPPETSLTLIGPNDCAQGFFCALLPQKDPLPGEEFEVKLYARSDIDEANLFQARMSFPVNLMEVSSIKTEGSFIKNWVENYYDNSTGAINLTGGVPAPGYQTKFGSESAYMATIMFKAKQEGTGTVSFNDDSAIYRNSDNQNILQYKDNTQVVIGKKKACDDAIGQSQLTGCLYDGKNFEKEDGQAPAGPILSSPVPDQAQALLQDWGYEAPNEIVGANEFSAGWAGQFQFKKGTYRFFAGADDGVSVQIDRALVLDDWSDGSYREREFNYTFEEEGTHLIELEYYENTGAAKVSLRWEYQDAPSPTPVPSPTSPPSSPPPGQKGDGNKDGKINLTDMSVLLTDFNKEKGFRESIDMNGDGKINTFDFSLHRKLLVELGVIKDKAGYTYPTPSYSTPPYSSPSDGTPSYVTPDTTQ